MDLQDKANNLLIYRLVKKHFSLTKESLDLFKFRLFEEPAVAKEYRKYLADDLRCRIKVTDYSLLADSDNGWRHFSNNFQNFVKKFNVSYEDFRKNIFNINGKKLKFKKALLEYFYNKDYFSKETVRELYNLSSRIFDSAGYSIRISYTTFEIRDKKNKIVSTELFHENFIASEQTKEMVSEKIDRFAEYIGNQKLPNKELYLVLSCNFADWFLCSTAESWESCLNLDSTYDSSYWAGLPGIISDKNRALLYLTDGTKKDYKGIKVDKILSRSWILTMRKGTRKKSKTFLHFVGEYPSSFDILDTVAQKEIFKEDIEIHSDRDEWKGRSRYYFEMLFHKGAKKSEKFLSYIFCDTSAIKVGTKSKCKQMKNTYAYHLQNGEDSGKTFITLKNNVVKKDCYVGFDFDGGLSCLVKFNDEISNHISGDNW